MNLKKPKFWDQKKPNIIAYLLLPAFISIRFTEIVKIKKKKKKI